MKVLVQRVSSASVFVNGEVAASIARGILAFVAVEQQDGDSVVERVCHLLTNYRIFPRSGRMHLSLLDVEGHILLVPQFTLLADCSGGLRPDFSKAPNKSFARPAFYALVDRLKNSPCERVQNGIFGFDMQIHSVNDGPVTFLLQVG